MADPLADAVRGAEEAGGVARYAGYSSDFGTHEPPNPPSVDSRTYRSPRGEVFGTRANATLRERTYRDLADLLCRVTRMVREFRNTFFRRTQAPSEGNF
jgi:hypothetical protein